MSSSDSQKKKVFIAPLNWGLGHATRLLPLIKLLLAKDYEVYIGASGRSKEVLQQEVKQCIFLDFPGYPIKYPQSSFFVSRFAFSKSSKSPASSQFPLSFAALNFSCFR